MCFLTQEGRFVRALRRRRVPSNTGCKLPATTVSSDEIDELSVHRKSRVFLCSEMGVIWMPIDEVPRDKHILQHPARLTLKDRAKRTNSRMTQRPASGSESPKVACQSKVVTDRRRPFPVVGRAPGRQAACPENRGSRSLSDALYKSKVEAHTQQDTNCYYMNDSESWTAFYH